MFLTLISGTTNIDIDVSNEATKRPLSEDVLLFSQPLLADSGSLDSSNYSVIHSNPEPSHYLEPQLAQLAGIRENLARNSGGFLHKKDSSRRVSQITLHLSDSRSNSCPDVADDVSTPRNSNRNQSRPQSATLQPPIQMRQRHSSDDIDLMPDIKVLTYN